MTKLWYRCDMCSPNQSHDFNVAIENPSLNDALRLVAEHHDRTYPQCPAAKNRNATVEILVRLVF